MPDWKKLFNSTVNVANKAMDNAMENASRKKAQADREVQRLEAKGNLTPEEEQKLRYYKQVQHNLNGF